MEINTLHCQPFAAIDNGTVRFKPGLNVIIGPNEAGKSTLVEALYSVLFQGVRLKRNNKSDIDFRQRALRYPSGDHAHIQLEFKSAGKVFKLTKHWQNQGSYIELGEEQGGAIRDEESVERYLQKMLEYGASTYANVLFARQHTFRQSLEQLKNDVETFASVDHLLKRAVMQLDGVSVDALRNRLEQEIQQLGKRWDLENNCPEGNRTLNNPFKSGVGEVLSCYYDKETIRMNLAAARQTESELEKLSRQLAETTQKKRIIIDQMVKYEGIEQQVIDRETTEVKLNRLYEDYQQLMTTNRDWPVKQEKCNHLKTIIQNLEEKEAKLGTEWQLTHNAQLLEQDRLLLKKSEELHEKMVTAAAVKEKYNHVNETDFHEIEKLETVMNRSIAVMEAATLTATMDAGTPVNIIPGFGERRTLKSGEKLKTSGCMTIESDLFTLTVSAGEIDFNNLKAAYERAAEEKQRLLDKLQASSIQDARSLAVMFREACDVLRNIESVYHETVNGKDLPSIRESLKEFESIRLRTLQEVNADRDDIMRELNAHRNLKSQLEKELKECETAYQSHDRLLDILVDKRAAIQELEKSLESLAVLPAGFHDTRSFLEHLRQLRKEKQELESGAYALQLQLERLRDAMPDESAEELIQALDLSEIQFEKQLNRLRKLKTISRTLESVLMELDMHSAEPLEAAFSGYLQRLTNNAYQKGIMNQFEVLIQGHGSHKQVIPALFSAGTYDTVALALRFALVDQLFPDKAAILVLDDCLVNLDPDRKASTISLIRQQAERHQLIFTTCHPETASALGGHHIQL